MKGRGVPYLNPTGLCSIRLQQFSLSKELILSHPTQETVPKSKTEQPAVIYLYHQFTADVGLTLPDSKSVDFGLSCERKNID
jgi:hypothetical protein